MPAASGRLSVFPLSLGILIPDTLRYAAGLPPSILPENLVFFDLETTGLSGGAGTVAFLAAFGRFSGPDQLRVNQYLLLDFPGECDFLEALLPEFAVPALGGKPPLIVSYNGKTFDAPLLRSRCLLNGIAPPDFPHADLLHPSRRLWKRLLPGCSQGEIETAVLGLDRGGDTPGALAPDIWFSFLKTGDPAGLMGICDHNIRDVFGLARLFAAILDIAENPENPGLRPGASRSTAYSYDLENLALHWRKACRRNPEIFGSTADTGSGLLREAARRNYPRAVFVFALDLFRAGRFAEGRARLLQLASGGGRDTVAEVPHGLRAAAYRALAIDAERRLRAPETALTYVEAALELGEVRESLRRELSRRKERLSR
jgi:uncharacterized protein YprB with RNaseH-like and TPR domain